MTQKTALITGITGQDGSYLAEFLLEKGYIVHGIKRRASSFNTQRVDHIYQDPHVDNANFKLHYGDLTDTSNLVRIIQETQPDEIYNLGAQSHVAVSFESPEYTADVDGMGTLRILEAIRILGLEKKTRFYQASTSELYGLVQETPQKETTPFYPRSPYAVAKLYAYWITVNYREAYGMYACNGILFNHESPRRGETFVTRKITRGLTSKGPALYWSDRVGRNNTIFKMPKFRSMRVGTPAVATHLLADPKAHLTPIGSFLRKSSLDELPQLWSILVGDMSFVGPRPALFNQHDLIELRTQQGVHTLVPGLTGWAQVNGRDELPIPDKVKLDVEYLQRQSLWFDIRILWLTFVKVLRRDGVSH